jgi:voltage-gated potassium channel
MTANQFITATHHAVQREAGPYQLFVLVLCVWAILLLGADTVLALDAGTRTILLYADTAVCVIFFADFLNSLYRAPNRTHYMLRWGWIDLLSSIPTIDILRLGRAARILRVLRVLRGIRSARVIGQFLMKRRAQSAFLASVLIALLFVVVSSIAALQFETAANGNIQLAEDAMWWAVSTMTTVGYGDRYPISAEGRLVAVFLMAAGVGVFGTFSGLVASWFLSPAAEETESNLEDVCRMLAELTAKVDALPSTFVAAGSQRRTAAPIVGSAGDAIALREVVSDGGPSAG